MKRKRFKPEEIISKLREAEVELAKGPTVPAVCKKIEVSEQDLLPLAHELDGLAVELGQGCA